MLLRQRRGMGGGRGKGSPQVTKSHHSDSDRGNKPSNWSQRLKRMDDEKLIYEVEKYKELYDPQNRYYKDISKREIIWEAVGAALGASPDDCKRRWKQLRDAYVKHKGKKTASGSAGGSQKEWRLAHLFSFIDSYLQPRSTLQPEGLREENIEAGEEEMGGYSASSLQGSRPCTPIPLTRLSSPFQSVSGQRSATTTSQMSRSDTPPPHPRVQELSFDTQRRKKKRQSREYSSAAVGVEQQLFEILTADKVSPPLHVPTREEAMGYYLHSFIPRINALPSALQNRFQGELLQLIERLEEEASDMQPHSSVFHGSTTRRSAKIQPAPQSLYYTHPPQHPKPPPPPPPQHRHHTHTEQQACSHGGVKRPVSFLEELEDPASPPLYKNL